MRVVRDPAAEPVASPAAQPVASPAAQPVASPAAQPVAEPASPAAEPAGTADRAAPPGLAPIPARDAIALREAGAVTSAARRRPRVKRRTGRRLFQFDRGLGVRWVAGADEAGRGCLAGPLVAAAVLFDIESLGVREVRALTSLNDSKQHDPEARDELYPVVVRTAAKVIVVSRCVRGIDARGLHKTNLAALRDALAGVARPGTLCLVDGFAVPEFGHEQRPIVDGDCTSAAIAAASIVAKVTRDRFMHRADALHPGWEFRSHVGYSTPEHRDAIQRQGVSPLHRLSFQSTAYQQLAL
jgi:ribonuclease HII